MFKNLAAAIFLTERDATDEDNEPKVKGRIVTTLPKAKEIRPIVERCITLAKRSMPHAEKAAEHGTDAPRNSDAWTKWRKGEGWKKWVAAMGPVIAARRKALRMLGSKQAVRILFAEVAPRFVDRPGGYTRILKLSRPRVGDAGARAILEFVGVRDRAASRSERPSFSDEGAE
jgi:large subunit ribosomal protein L17